MSYQPNRLCYFTGGTLLYELLRTEDSIGRKGQDNLGEKKKLRQTSSMGAAVTK
jgi:hypothetical protein